MPAQSQQRIEPSWMRTPSLDRILAQVFATYDEQFGGFGTEPKFPLTAPILLALDIYQRSHDERMRVVAETTLDAMADGGLYDEVDGGFFRYATTRDWQLPHDEKLLDVNAALLSLYVRAADVLQSDRYRELSAAIVQLCRNVARRSRRWLVGIAMRGS